MLSVRSPLPLQPRHGQPQDDPGGRPRPQPRRRGHNVRSGDDSSPEQKQVLIIQADDHNHPQL